MPAIPGAVKSVRALQGDTVDLIAARSYDGDTGMAPAILDANPGLAALGLIVPVGTLVILPAKKVTPKTQTSLWD